MAGRAADAAASVAASGVATGVMAAPSDLGVTPTIDYDALASNSLRPDPEPGPDPVVSAGSGQFGALDGTPKASGPDPVKKRRKLTPPARRTCSASRLGLRGALHTGHTSFTFGAGESTCD